MTEKRFEVTFNELNYNLRDNENYEELHFTDEKNCYEYISNLLNNLHEEKEFYKNIVEEISYSLIDYNRLEINKELNEHINSVNTLEEFKEWINKGKEEFKKEYQWLK